MNDIRQWLKGKKAHLVLIGAIGTTVFAWSQGAIETKDAVEAIFAALTGMAFRAAYAKGK